MSQPQVDRFAAGRQKCLPETQWQNGFDHKLETLITSTAAQNVWLLPGTVQTRLAVTSFKVEAGEA
jgi:hypothetical protein